MYLEISNKRKPYKVRRDKVYSVDYSDFEIKWNELLYDLIFIIVIEKIISMYISSPVNTDLLYIGMLISIFIMVLWIWNRRIVQTNHMNILEKELNKDIPQYKFLTYFEMTLLLILIHGLGNFTDFNFYITIIIIEVIFQSISMHILRNQLLNHYKHESEEVYLAFKTFWDIRNNSINVKHILERFCVLTILFLGETLREVFLSEANYMVLILFCIIIFNIFESSTKVFKAIERQSLKANKIKYKKLTSYLKRSLVLLILLILSITYTHEYNVKYPIALIVVLIINKIHQEFALYKLEKSFINKYEIIYAIYYVFIIIFVLIINSTDIYTLGMILVLAVLELKKDSYYNDQIDKDKHTLFYKNN